MTWAGIDNFEAGSNQGLNTWNGGSGWSQNWGATVSGGDVADFQIDTTQTISGTRSVHITSSSTGNSFIQRNATGDLTSGSLYFAMRAAQTNKKFEVIVAGNTGSGKATVYFNTDGNIKFAGDDGQIVLQSYSANVWYYINMEWDPSNGIRARVGTGHSWGPFSAWTTVAEEEFGGLQLEYIATGVGPEWWLDNITTSDPLVKFSPFPSHYNT